MSESHISHKQRLTVTLTLRAWSTLTGVKESTIRWKLKQGFSPKDAIARPKEGLMFRDHCDFGHPVNQANLYIGPDGNAQCRECRKASKRKSLKTLKPLTFAQLKAKAVVFWSKVIRGKGCWSWTGGSSGKYGQFSVSHHQFGPHRAALSLKLGRLVKGMTCHKCGNPKCCRPSHLYEDNSKMNAADAIRHGTKPHGEKVFGAKLKATDVLKIRKARLAGKPLQELASHFGVSISTISNIALGKIWRHV